MTHFAIALYLGESYASLSLFESPLESPIDSLVDLSNDESKDKRAASVYEKSVYLPQTSLKNLLLQTLNANQGKKISSIYIVTRYFDRLKTFRLGGSVIQVIPVGFENSYSLSDTQLHSLAAPALILPVLPDITAEKLSIELQRLKKVNAEINKVVLQLPEHLFSASQKENIYNFFIQENFKIFNVPHPLDFTSVRQTLLNAGSEGTKDEILSDVREALGEDIAINFWINNSFSTTFENIDLYFSSHFFLKNYMQTEKLSQVFYFDVENWEWILCHEETKWQSPWGLIHHLHPQKEEFFISPYSELTINSIGQLVVSNATPQYEPGPIVAGRSVKTLILDAFSEELKTNCIISQIFPQVLSDPIQQKVNTQFQILQKAQSIDQIRISKAEIKTWLQLSVTAWILQNFNSKPARIIGDLGASFYQHLKKNSAFSFAEFSWTTEIMKEAQKKRNLI